MPRKMQTEPTVFGVLYRELPDDMAVYFSKDLQMIFRGYDENPWGGRFPYVSHRPVFDATTVAEFIHSFHRYGVIIKGHKRGVHPQVEVINAAPVGPLLGLYRGSDRCGSFPVAACEVSGFDRSPVMLTEANARYRRDIALISLVQFPNKIRASKLLHLQSVLDSVTAVSENPEKINELPHYRAIHPRSDNKQNYWTPKW